MVRNSAFRPRDNHDFTQPFSYIRKSKRKDTQSLLSPNEQSKRLNHHELLPRQHVHYHASTHSRSCMDHSTSRNSRDDQDSKRKFMSTPSPQSRKLSWTRKRTSRNNAPFKMEFQYPGHCRQTTVATAQILSDERSTTKQCCPSKREAPRGSRYEWSSKTRTEWFNVDFARCWDHQI